MEQTRPIWKSMLAGAVTAIIVMLILSAIAALLISKTVIPEKSADVVGIIIALVSSFAGNMIAGRLQGGKLLVTCIGSAAVYLAALLLVKAAFYGSWGNLSIPMVLGILGCGIAASIVPVGTAKHRKRR